MIPHHMQTAYCYLFEIETTLRSIAEERMQQAYGHNWRRIAPSIHKRIRKNFETLRFHDLISWFRIYPPLQGVFPQDFLSDLLSIVPIRNKIAHCHVLTKVKLHWNSERMFCIIILEHSLQLLCKT